MSIKQLPLTLIVAATPKNGIGQKGALPWPMLKKEMAYFARVTKRVPMPPNNGSVQSDASKQVGLEGMQRNVVIMGRKTWDSIPPKFRPLKDRTSIVISAQDRTTLGGIPEDVVVASDILSGLQTLEQRVRHGDALPVGRTFVIGGSSIYEAALQLPQTKAVLLTRIKKDYECDTFFPDGFGDSGSGWRRSTLAGLRSFVGEDVPEGPLAEGKDGEDISYEFQLYERS
ncbi:hypothetical protein LTR08_008069 [Meristemomyces frigidus]|nr:hypothetical protein LTR08_008069 [Meristemomyces frigidus]